MVDKLYSKGYVDKGFKKRIRKGKESTRALNESVALPHPINYKATDINKFRC